MIYPMFAMALLTLVVLFINLVLRIRAARTGAVDLRYFKTFQGDAPGILIAGARNYSNLFEMPVLFYVACILAIVTHTQGSLVVGLAWTYVVLRAVHSWIHITRNHVYSRLAAFAASVIVLVIIWIFLGIRFFG